MKLVAYHGPVAGDLHFTVIPPWLLSSLGWATIAFTASILVFVVQYTLTSPWWYDPVGSTIVLKDLLLLAILVPSSVAFLWPDLIDRLLMAEIDLAVLAAATLVMVSRCVVWWHIKRPVGFRAYQDDPDDSLAPGVPEGYDEPPGEPDA